MNRESEFDKLWKNGKRPRDKVSRKIWDSMKPSRLAPAVPDDSDLNANNAFKKEHSAFAKEVLPALEMICKKCLLFSDVCRAMANHVKEADEMLLKTKTNGTDKLDSQ